MKLKSIAFLFVLTLFTAVSAQTDVSKYFLKNHGFDSDFNYTADQNTTVAQEIKAINEWTQDFSMNYTITGVYEFGFQGKYNGASVPSAGYDGEAGGGLALSTGWGMEMKYYQDIWLPSGNYTISVPTYNGVSTTGGSSLLAWIPEEGTAVSSTVKSYPGMAWTMDEISFTLTETTSGKIQIGYKAADGASSNSAKILIDYVQIKVTDMGVEKKFLNLGIDVARDDYYKDGTGNGAAALKEAIDKAQAVRDDTTVDMIAVIEATDELWEAIETYRRANVSEENPVDYTYCIENNSFEYASSTSYWYVENMVPQTNSSFTKKNGTTYMEKWTGSGSVGDGKLTQSVAMPVGKYKLTVAAQNYTQSSTSKKNTGAYIFAGDQKETVYTPADYSVKFNNIGNRVNIGFVAENATGNWICADNFRLYLIGYMSDEEVKEELTRIVNVAKELDKAMISDEVREGLEIDIAVAEKMLSGEDEYVSDIADGLYSYIELATQSKAQYEALQAAIEETEKTYDETKEGSDAFKAELDKAKLMMTDGKVTAAEIEAEIEALATAKLLFLVANGTGAVPTVTTRTNFMIPAAHGGLIRATFAPASGTTIKERGICWSTEKNPTIADTRETDYYSQKGTLFHLKKMQPASVYYARAYAITNTYAVGYGDVIKVVTLPKGSCVGTWDNGAPDEAANNRCRTAIQETMDYLNEWTAIKGFTLSGHYGATTPTADCSYGGYMRIGPNAGNQAIGTVIHETGHGVGVGTHWRWYSCADTRANTTYGKWLGSWANKTLHFLENTTDEAVFMTGDGTHGWGTGPGISYDWFVNGADKDKHTPAQYIGGCALLYSLYVDGLCPTSGYSNGVPGYTFNYDDETQYCIIPEDPERGNLGEGFLYQRSVSAMGWKEVLDREQLTDSVKWTVEFVPLTGYYRFRNAATGRYMTHSATGTAVTMKNTSKPTTTENFQLMPGREDVTVTVNGTSMKLPSFWFTWYDSSDRSMSLNAMLERLGYGSTSIVSFDFSDKGGASQRYIIVPADKVAELLPAAGVKGDVSGDKKVDISDVVAVINHIAGIALNEKCDVSGDGKVDISDVVAIINIIAGI